MKSYLNAFIIGLSVIITAMVLGNAFQNRNKSSNTISVTGLGTKDFVSDLIVWSGNFSKRSPVLKDAYAELDKDREIIRKYLKSKGISDGNIVFSAVGINKEFETIYDTNMNVKEQRFSGYLLDQTVTIESKEVDEIEDISRQVSELINSGVEFYSQEPQYYYTKLSELKIEMIAQATKDANERAERIAVNAGSSIGSLKNASMGVFQIVAQNSAEDFSWGGSFNTTSKRKTANITVKLEYEV
ncbi:MAG: SIMPL domain-containing protein, partial [Bacteroidota bacterium]